MTSKPNKPIMLFDCKTSQNIIGQDKFLKAFENILNHGAYCQGPETKELDEKLAAYSGVKYCSTCGSGTDALTLALMAWGVKEGDAVFVSSFTFVASAEAPVLLGATPIFVDSDPDTYNMDPKDLQRAIDQVKKEGKLNLKAVIPVDIFGSPCNYDEIIKIAHENGMKVLADSCQSYGSVYKGKKAGSIADMTATSFYPTKPLGELSEYFGKQKILEGCRSAYALYTVHCEDRDELMSYLKENGIPCGAYYPRPVNTQTAYAKWNTRSLPVCERLSKTALSIPMTPYLDNEDLDYVIARMNEFAAKKMSRAA